VVLLLGVIVLFGRAERPSCLEQAVFGPPSESPYLLPYAVGTGHEVFQTYCGPQSHGRDDQMSIDFLMPVGTDVLAAQSGLVRVAVDEHPDFGRAINYVFIEHEDGTVAFYAHLHPGSVLVGPGDSVKAGQSVAKSGSSGTSIAHLHFGVSSSWPPRHTDDMPVNFRNAGGPLDEKGGLKPGVVYQALAPSS
jgi:murein DD-endopeptidase MepM/ murein hydrolase activator NlpD